MAIIDRVMRQEYLSPKDKIEIIREIKEVMDCDEKTYERREGKLFPYELFQLDLFIL